MLNASSTTQTAYLQLMAVSRRSRSTESRHGHHPTCCPAEAAAGAVKLATACPSLCYAFVARAARSGKGSYCCDVVALPPLMVWPVVCLWLCALLRCVAGGGCDVVPASQLSFLYTRVTRLAAPRQVLRPAPRQPPGASNACSYTHTHTHTHAHAHKQTNDTPTQPPQPSH
jgi:hypothetical protein